MATCMTQWVTLVLLVVPFLIALQMVDCRPAAGDDEYLFTYGDDVKPQRQERFTDDVKQVLTLLTNLRAYHQRRHQLPDVIRGSTDVIKVPVELRKRQPQCYWNVVSCY